MDTETKDILEELTTAQESHTAALREVKPPVVENHNHINNPPANPTPLEIQNVIQGAKGWRFRVIEWTAEGRIQEFTATPIL